MLKQNTACSGLRLGCKYDASKISPERRFDITDMGVVFYPTRFLVSELTLEIEGAASVRAVAIEEYVPGNVFTDYETFTFYATIINIPASGKDKEISFRPYVIYNDGVIEYGDVLARSYNYVVANTLAVELGDNEIPAPDDWWAPAK